MSDERAPTGEEQASTGEERALGRGERASVRDVMAIAKRRERQQALRALLQRPLLTRGGDDEARFRLVSRHADWLREWLGRNVGWSLYLDPEVARLRKLPASPADPTRPARDARSKLPFSRRRYMLVCLALAALERAERQTTLGRLAEEVSALWAADPRLAAPETAFDLERGEHRRDLAAAIRLLLGWQVLVRVQGDEDAYVADRGDVLYNVRRPVLASFSALRRGPSTLDATGFEARLAALVAEPVPETPEGRNRALRMALTRRLLDDPLVAYADLGPEALAYMASQRGHLAREVAEATGLVPEARAEGLAMTDEDGDLTDRPLPEEGTDGHVTLLVADALAEALRRGAVPVGRAALERRLRREIGTYGPHWRKDAQDPAAAPQLVALALGRLAELWLVRIDEEDVWPAPPIARYRLNEARPPRRPKEDPGP